MFKIYVRYYNAYFFAGSLLRVLWICRAEAYTAAGGLPDVSDSRFAERHCCCRVFYHEAVEVDH